MYLEVSKQEENYGWCFWSRNDIMKGKCDTFSGYKQTRKASLVNLELKLHQESCGWS